MINKKKNIYIFMPGNISYHHIFSIEYIKKKKKKKKIGTYEQLLLVNNSN
jgi:accessory gene regulator protein AgrB